MNINDLIVLPIPSQKESLKNKSNKIYINSIWSVWYALAIAIYQIILSINLIIHLFNKQKDIKLNYELIIFLIFIILILIVLYLISEIRQIGNYSNDLVKFGQSYFIELEYKNRKRGLKWIFTTIWRHFFPLSSFIHLIISIIILYSNIILINNQQEINLKVFIDKRYEIFNYFLAFSTLYLRYSSVFWLINKYLSFLITFLGFLCSLLHLFHLFSFLYLLVHIRDALIINNNSFIDLFLVIKNTYTLVYLYFLLKFLSLFTLVPVYCFVYLKYCDKINLETIKLNPNDSIKCKNITTNTSYCTNLCAAIQLIVICACKIPFFYNHVILYNLNKNSGILMTIILDIIYLILLISVWLILTLKSKWSIRLDVTFMLTLWAYLNQEQDFNTKNVNHDDDVDYLPQTKEADQILNDYFINSETLYRNEIRKSFNSLFKNLKEKPIYSGFYYNRLGNYYQQTTTQTIGTTNFYLTYKPNQVAPLIDYRPRIEYESRV